MKNKLLEVNGKIINYNKDDIIFSEGDECKYVGYVLVGEVIIHTSSILYNDFLISTIKEGDLFGVNLLFSNNPYYLGTVEANKKTSIKFISKKEYTSFVSNNLEEFLSYTSNKFISLQQRLKVLSQKTIREKILFYLVNKSNLLNTYTIPIPKKEELARYLKIERPSLSRELANLKKDGFINYNRKSITIMKRDI